MNHWMKYTNVRSQVFAPDNHDAGLDEAIVWEELPDSERFDALMSLALDSGLSVEEEAEFECMLGEDAGRNELWNDWQAFDHAFRTTPIMEPPVDFVAAFEERLIKQERRRRLWLGFGVGMLAVLLWSGLVAGLAGASAYVMFNQSDWLTTMVRAVAHWGATIQAQAAVLASAAATALSAPQVQAMVVAYVLFAGMALWFWARFLRRTVADEGRAAAVVS